ncbi:Hypothetical predicted protein [Cloeon dipterum]|uniref:Ankyrin repeat domain-containing protein n=1 Tax=Cloeon dipterum TaxID=197152 RepID=A0A8S1DVH7_9INSE|nr:Hypothetical predicted protein [Cloeon dipterum]
MTESIKRQYPLHWHVWHNDYVELDAALRKNSEDKEKKDPRGRSPLMLAVTLGHLESVRVLLNHHANVNTENKECWTAVQEATATGDPDLLQMVLERRDYQRYSSRIGGVPELLQRLKDVPDFYVEMKWEFTSWVPLVARMCPSDTYKLYKQGSNVRIDTTLLGFDQTNWQRGDKSYIFKGQSDSALMIEVDHEKREVLQEEMRMIGAEELSSLHPSSEALGARLSTPIVTTYVDTEKISFERNKSGIWGWRADKLEEVNGHECKVFSANNVELVTKTRMEHLSAAERSKIHMPKSAFQSFLGIAETEERAHSPSQDLIMEESKHQGNPCNISVQDYFSTIDLEGRDIGRPKDVHCKIQKFRANLWLAEKYPLTLPEQIMPIVDLMAISSTHFAKLKDFIQMQLPAGFPVKIEIPLFHVLNARITFGNIFGMDEEVAGVTRVGADDALSCVVDEACFEPPPGYSVGGADPRRQFSMEDEDELLQFAIQQSLLDSGTEADEVDIWEALKSDRRMSQPAPNLLQAEEERQLQRAIQASLAHLAGCSTPPPLPPPPPQEQRAPPDGAEGVDADLHLALMLSQQEQDQTERQRQEEERIVQQVLALSLTEK